MTNNRKFAATSIVTAFAVIGAALPIRRIHKDLYVRFPDVDRKIIRQAYRHFLVRIAKGQIDVDGLDYDAMDKLLLEEVTEMYAA